MSDLQVFRAMDSWTTTFVGAATVNHPAVSATTWTTEFVAAAGRETFGAVSTTWGPVGFYALGLSTLPIETEGFVFAWRVDPVLTAVRLDEASVTWRVDPVLTAVETSGV